MRKAKILKKEFKNSPPHRKIYMILGGIFLLAAVVGIALPIIPQVPFAILSAFFFSKGSQRIHKWILNNKYVGTPVYNWEQFKVLSPGVKAGAVVGCAVAAYFGHDKMLLPWALALDAILVGTLVFVMMCPSHPPKAHAKARAKV